MAGKVRQKKFDLWLLTLMGQISQAQNAILEIAFLSAALFLCYDPLMLGWVGVSVLQNKFPGL